MDVDISSLIAALGGAGIALIASWLRGRQDRTTARSLAAEARRQDRLEAAYLELLAYISRIRREADAVLPASPVFAANELAPIEPTEKLRVEALVSAYASPRVWDLMDRLWMALIELQTTDVAYNQLGGNPSARLAGLTAAEHHERAQGLKDLISEIEDAIGEQIRSELGSEPRRRAAPGE